MSGRGRRRCSTTRIWCRTPGSFRSWVWPSGRACPICWPAGAAGATGQVLVRVDSAYGNRHITAACRRAGAQFSLVLTKNPTVTAAIHTIPGDAWQPVHYPGAVVDPDTGQRISAAHVVGVQFTALTTREPVTALLIVRRVRDQAKLDELFQSGGTTRSSPTAPNP